jgi:probable addiction module antidote protein
MRLAMVTLSMWDTLEYLDSEEEIAGFLEAVIAEGGAAAFPRALTKAAQARAVNQLAKETGMDRGELCRMLSVEGGDQVMTPEAAERLARAFAVPV